MKSAAEWVRENSSIKGRIGPMTPDLVRAIQVDVLRDIQKQILHCCGGPCDCERCEQNRYLAQMIENQIPKNQEHNANNSPNDV